MIRCPHGSQLVWFLMGLYQIIANALLLNLLIAMFSNTFDRINADAALVWKFQVFLTLTLTGGLCKGHWPWNRFCEKLYRIIDSKNFENLSFFFQIRFKISKKSMLEAPKNWKFFYEMTVNWTKIQNDHRELLNSLRKKVLFKLIHSHSRPKFHRKVRIWQIKAQCSSRRPPVSVGVKLNFFL